MAADRSIRCGTDLRALTDRRMSPPSDICHRMRSSRRQIAPSMSDLFARRRRGHRGLHDPVPTRAAHRSTGRSPLAMRANTVDEERCTGQRSHPIPGRPFHCNERVGRIANDAARRSTDCPTRVRGSARCVNEAAGKQDRRDECGGRVRVATASQTNLPTAHDAGGSEQHM
jgi:hypothetical protein